MRILILLIFFTMMGCSRTPLELQSVKNSYTLDSLSLEQGFNSYVKSVFLDEESIEAGRISFADGDSADYWFKTHHATNDAGYTLFVFSDEKELLMEGWFCCEVHLPKNQLNDKNELIRFIEEHSGIRP